MLRQPARGGPDARLRERNVESLAVQTLGEVCQLAREHPDVNYVRVAFTMSKAGLSDKYGNAAKDAIQMGGVEGSWSTGRSQAVHRASSL
jgi:hypothetical protein